MFHPSLSLTRSFRFTAGATLLLTLGACTTGQTGGEVSTDDAKGGGLLGGPGWTGDDIAGNGEDGSTLGGIYAANCEESEPATLDLDKSTSLGVSAADLIAMVEGKHEATLSWGHTNCSPGEAEGEVLEGPGEGEEDDDIPVTPKAGASTIEIDIKIVSGSAEFVESEQIVPESSDGDSQGAKGEIDTLEGRDPIGDVVEQGNVRDDAPDPAVDSSLRESEVDLCPDEIRFEADVTIVSDNGAFDDSFRATFTAKNGVFVSTVIELEPGALDGDFDVDVSKLENGKATNTQLTLAFVMGSMSGKITGAIEESNDQWASQMSMRYGHFPADACDTGYLVGSESEWAKDLSSTLEENGEFDFEWLNEDSTTLTVESSLGKICYEPNNWGEGDALRAELNAKVSTEDGRIDGEWPLSLQVYLAQDGEAELINVYRENYFGNTYSVDQLESQMGISVASEAEDLNFEFSYFIDPEEDGPVSGNLAIFEVTPADCSNSSFPEQSPDGEDQGGEPAPTSSSDAKSDGSEDSGSSSSGGDSEQPPTPGDSNADDLPNLPGIGETDTEGSDSSEGSVSGAPGCAGNKYIEIEAATFSKK